MQLPPRSGVDLPRAALSQMVPPLVGGVPVDYGPRLVDNRQPPTLTPPPKPAPQKSNDEDVPSRLLWIGNVSGDTSDAVLKQVFSKYGNVDYVAVYPQRSYGFVEFRNLEDSKTAKTGMQGQLVKGQPLRIEFAKPAKPSKHLWIWGVSETVSKEQLETEFKKFGALEDFKILRDGKCALAEYKKLEDASAAVEGLNKRNMGGEELRVDFLRSQPLKRGIAGRMGGDLLSSEMALGNVHAHNVVEDKGSKEGEPSETLWIGFPAAVRVDEERLRRAFILFGEVERIKTFPDRSYCFVQFRNADEASRAKEGLQGRLFNDPRVQIRFSNNEGGLGSTTKVDGPFVSPLHRRDGLLDSTGPRLPLGAIDRFGPNSPNMNINISGRHSVLQHDIRGRGLGRPVGVLPTSGFGSNPLVGGGVSDTLFPLEGAGIRMNSRIAPSPINIGSANASRPVMDGRILPDNDYSQREFKRPKVENINSAGLSGRAPMLDARLVGREALERLQRGLPYGNDGSEHVPTLRAHPGSSNVDAGGGISRSATTESIFAPGILSRMQGADVKWKWQGSIAKAGTFVCGAQSFPIGRGIDATLPDVVNCVARTSLDMLAQHFNQAVDFGVIFFVPDGENETRGYRDFIRYLGDKLRAGVAKFNDGTTLFLVPPSQFSERILKLPGDLLFGLVIKSPQVGSLPPTYQQQQQQQQTLLQEQNHLQQLSRPQFKPIPDDLTGNLKPSLGSLAGWSASSSNTVTPPSQTAGLPLTPELIASLTSLIPVQRQGPFDGAGGTNASDVFTTVSGMKSAEFLPHDQNFSAQRLASAPFTTLGVTNLNLHHQSEQQPNTVLPSSLSAADAQTYIGQVSGIHNVNLRSPGGLLGLPTKDLNQLATFLQRPQQHTQFAQQQTTFNSQLQLPNAAQTNHSGSSLPSLDQGLQHRSSNGLLSNPNTAAGQTSESGIIQEGRSVEAERNNRFQATLQLAASLLRRMHNPAGSEDTPQSH